jgi:hypothetical protein
VEWYRAGDFNSAADTTSTFEVILNGATNGILFQYLSVGTTNLDSTAIVGIQMDATTGLLYYLGGATQRPPELIVHDSLAISFNPRFAVNVANDPVRAPVTYALEQNYPNPFNPKTEIRYQVSGVSLVKITVYDLLGREVTTLVNEPKAPGSYEVSFDGSGLSSGVYIYRMTAGSFVQSRKMLLLK